MPEKTLVMLVVITRRTGRLFAPGLYVLLPSPLRSRLMLAVISHDQNVLGPRGGAGKQGNAVAACSREPTPNNGFGQEGR